MRAKHRFAYLTTGLLAILLAAPALGANLNKSIKIESGTTSDGASTVNGSVKVGKDAIVTGDVSTVNGTIRVYENARVEDVETVNGSLRIGDGVHAENLSSVNGSVQVGTDVIIDGEVSVVNGKISLESGTKVSRDVSNVNGEINLEGAEVGGDIETVNGDVLLSDQAVLRGDLTIKKPSGWGNNHNRRIPKVIIGPGSRVGGTIFIEQKVELFVSTTAEVGGVSGVMSMDDAVRFDGEWP
jgi:UDP-3-O-[3-hydroxymyristoyl] glucosamine N-acyltransferase